jgi:hypothetical protein
MSFSFPSRSPANSTTNPRVFRPERGTLTIEPTRIESRICSGTEYQKPLSTAKLGTSGTTRAVARLRGRPLP